MSKVNAFGHPWRNAQEIPDFPEDRFIVKYGLELEKETGTTKPVIAEKIDLQELIESYKEQTGLANVLRLIKTGQLDPSVLADDGKGGIDLTQVPDYAGDLLRQKQATEAAKNQIMDALGIESLDGDIEAIVNKAVEAKIAEIQAKSQTASEGDK